MNACRVCRKPLEYAGSGRPRDYCGRRCKRRAERKRARFALFRPRPAEVSPPVSSPESVDREDENRPLPRAEQEAILGRPLAQGATFEEYLGLTGRGRSGGFLR